MSHQSLMTNIFWSYYGVHLNISQTHGLYVSTYMGQTVRWAADIHFKNWDIYTEMLCKTLYTLADLIQTMPVSRG